MLLDARSRACPKRRASPAVPIVVCELLGRPLRLGDASPMGSCRNLKTGFRQRGSNRSHCQPTIEVSAFGNGCRSPCRGSTLNKGQLLGRCCGRANDRFVSGSRTLLHSCRSLALPCRISRLHRPEDIGGRLPSERIRLIVDGDHYWIRQLQPRRGDTLELGMDAGFHEE